MKKRNYVINTTNLKQTSLSLKLYLSSKSRHVSGITCRSSGGTTRTQIWLLLCNEICNDILVLIYAVSYDMYTIRTVKLQWLRMSKSENKETLVYSLIRVTSRKGRWKTDNLSTFVRAQQFRHAAGIYRWQVRDKCTGRGNVALITCCQLVVRVIDHFYQATLMKARHRTDIVNFVAYFD
jgi:hypothetical protein